MFFFIFKYFKGYFLCIKVYVVNKNKVLYNYLCLNVKFVY